MSNQVNTSRIPKKLSDEVIPKRYDVNSMADKEVPRSIRFPAGLWAKIDTDAEQHKRSSVKHLEFLLSAYYRGNAPQLNFERMQTIKGKPEPPEDLSYEDFMREIDLLNISHIEFLGDMRNASSTRRREVLDDIRRVIKGPIKSFTKPEDNEYPTLE